MCLARCNMYSIENKQHYEENVQVMTTDTVRTCTVSVSVLLDSLNRLLCVPLIKMFLFCTSEVHYKKVGNNMQMM